jgi:hypothetical protein
LFKLPEHDQFVNLAEVNGQFDNRWPAAFSKDLLGGIIIHKNLVIFRTAIRMQDPDD